MSPGAPLAVAAGAWLAGAVLGRRSPAAWLALTLVGGAGALAAAALVLGGSTGAWDWHGPPLLGGQGIHLLLDPLSAYFLALLAFVGTAGAIYSRGYWSDRQFPTSAAANRTWWNGLLTAMGAVLLAANGLQFLVCWELFAVCSYFLITLDRTQRQARAAGWLYLAASHAGTLCLFAFFTLLCVRTGSWELGPMRQHPELAPLVWIALAGFGIKAGAFPLHIWLPSAHANAPSHVSALMSGVAIKLGLYGIFRFTGWLPTPPAIGWTIVAIGGVSALLGIVFALAQNDLKRLLAYSSVENVGVVLIGLGGALLGVTHLDATWGRIALAGALLHIWNHGVFKSLLFFCAGSVLHGTGTREMSRLGGLWRAMPWTATLFGVGAMAVSALPPFNGFVSEWLIYRGLFDAVIGHTAVVGVALAAIITLAVTGAVAAAAFVKAAGTVFLGAPRSAAVRTAHECNAWMRAPMIAGALLVAVLGFAPVAAWPAVARAAEAWHPAWDSAAGEPLMTVTFAQLTVAAALAGGILLLWRRATRATAPRQPTWDCGYTAPTSRMQYTSGSFGMIVTGWFRWILRPSLDLRRPRGAFPLGAHRAEMTPDTVLDRGVTPVGRGVLLLAGLVRRLQHGRLQFYIAYVIAGLVGLAALAIAGGKP